MSNMSRRDLLVSMAIAPIARAFKPQAAAPTIRVRTLSHFGLQVADVKRSVDFYQGLFGMPIQAHAGENTILRIGAGPQFISIAPAGGAAPSINHYCLGVEGFNVDRVLAALAAHGITKADATAVMKVAVSTRDGGTPDLLFGDPDGIVCQLQDATYCGGTGPLGNRCPNVEPSPKKGLIALKDLSHLTIFSGDAARSNKFYQEIFGMPYRSYQGPTAPTLAIGPTVEFLMLTGGGPGGGGASAPPRAASINHYCMNLEKFNADQILKTLESYGVKPRENATGAVGPMRHYLSMRMENRGGAKEGTPELYFTDPDGILVQLQDVSYCGGGGVLGNVCPPIQASR